MLPKPICIIPARGGSKRIPGKNIKDFNGKPMIAWSILTAIESGIFSQVIVSTDDENIAKTARAYGAEIPYMRDADLADDFATTASVLIDAVERLPAVQHACCFYPTAPMVLASDLVSAHYMITSENADSVISVCEFDFHPLRAFKTNEKQTLSYEWPEHENTRSQDLPSLIHDAGAFYFFDCDALKSNRSLVMENTLGLTLPRSRAVDIDTPEDFELARHLHLKLIEGNA